MSNCELKPARVFEQFAEINKIPRPSKHEEQMIEYLKEFGRKRNLETEIDETGNVIIRKPATKGHENAPMISLQSHMDMVISTSSTTLSRPTSTVNGSEPKALLLVLTTASAAPSSWLFSTATTLSTVLSNAFSLATRRQALAVLWA